MRMVQHTNGWIATSIRVAHTAYQALCLASIFFLQCGSADTMAELTRVTRHTGTSAGAVESAHPIDRGKTYEFYFRLEQPDECLKVSLTAKTVAAGLGGAHRIVISYFAVDKLVDISAFQSVAPGKSVYSEIGRNFDHRWNRERELLVCSSREDPIKKFTPGLYKIRFTTFSPAPFSFEVTIHSRQAIRFFDRP